MRCPQGLRRTTGTRRAHLAAGALAAIFVAGCASLTPAGMTAQATSQVTLIFRSLDDGGPATKGALRRGEVDIAMLFSSDGDIGQNAWVTLQDDNGSHRPENVVPLVRYNHLSPAAERIINRLSAKLTTEELVALNRQHTIAGEDTRTVAANWLTRMGLLSEPFEPLTDSWSVGSTQFGEHRLLAELYRQILAAAGAKIEPAIEPSPDRQRAMAALQRGDFDLYPEYLGASLAHWSTSQDVPPHQEAALEELGALLSVHGLAALSPAPAQNAPSLVVTRATADRYQLSKVSDLSKVRVPLRLGGPPECPKRPSCLAGLQRDDRFRFQR